MSELEYIRSKLRDYMNQVADHMAGGGCSNYEDYRYSVGMVNAFAMLERDIIDLEEKVKES